MKTRNVYKIATLKVLKIGETAKRIKAMTPDEVYKIMKFIEKEDREQLYALHLNAKNDVIAKELISIGTLNNSLFHPREAFKGAILNNSACVIFVHNHPSGDAAPSQEDLTITKRAIEAGELLGIPVIDHLIIGDGKYASVKICLDRITQNKELTIKKQTDSAIDILIKANENLKGKKTLKGARIKSLSRTLRRSVYKLFLSQGVSESCLRECYRGTAENLKR